jgi:hypothetical protein
MADYPNLPARYSNGNLKLRRRLQLPEGTEVRVTITVAPKSARRARRKYHYPNRPFPPQALAGLVGLVSLGGDALADSEALDDAD